MNDYSVSPSGEKFSVPQESEYAGELERIGSLVEAARDEGKEIVVVMDIRLFMIWWGWQPELL